MRGRILAAPACSALAAVAAPAIAQAPPSLTWIAYAQGKPGKTTEWLNFTLKQNAPIYDKLLAAGVVRSWGIATPINHRPGFAWNLLTWVTADDWAGVEKWAGAAMQAMQGRSEQETKAIEASYEAVEDGRSHFDEVVRNAVFVPGKPGAKIGYFLAASRAARCRGGSASGSRTGTRAPRGGVGALHLAHLALEAGVHHAVPPGG